MAEFGLKFRRRKITSQYSLDWAEFGRHVPEPSETLAQNRQTQHQLCSGQDRPSATRFGRTRRHKERGPPGSLSWARSFGSGLRRPVRKLPTATRALLEAALADCLSALPALRPEPTRPCGRCRTRAGGAVCYGPRWRRCSGLTRIGRRRAASWRLHLASVPRGFRKSTDANRGSEKRRHRSWGPSATRMQGPGDGRGSKRTKAPRGAWRGQASQPWTPRTHGP